MKHLFSIITILAFGVHSLFGFDVYLSLSSHKQRADLGISGFIPETLSLEESKFSRQIENILRNDLLLSRYFNIVENGPLYTGQEEDIAKWYLLGAGILVCGKLKIKDNEILVTAQLYDTDSKKIIWEKKIKGESNDYRKIAHEINDNIILHLTGAKGIAKSRIVFCNRRNSDKELYMVDYDGYGLKQLTHNNSINILPKWSPDSEEIVYTTYCYGNPDLYAIYLGDNSQKVISQRQGLNIAGSFSPDGNLIIATLSREQAPNLYLLKRTGEILRQLTFGDDIKSSASFAPNGNEIVFISDNPGMPELFIMNFDGGNIRKLPARGYCDSPCWSPLGDKIVFTMRQGNENYYNLYVYDLHTLNITQLTQNEGSNENPSWSPDGRFIVFSSTRSDKNELYVIGADGSGLRKLVDITGDCYLRTGQGKLGIEGLVTTDAHCCFANTDKAYKIDLKGF